MPALAKRKHPEPKRASGDENADAGTRIADNGSGNNDRERTDPKNPTLSPLTNVVLAAGETYNSREPEQISGLIAIRERPEITFVLPERRRGFGEPKQNANPGKESNTGTEPAQGGP